MTAPTPRRPYDSVRWRQLRKRIIARDGGCIVCGSQESLDVDHIQSWETGGAWYDEDNLRTLCRTHHNRKPARRRAATPNRRRQPTTTAGGDPTPAHVRRDWLDDGTISEVVTW